MAKPSALKIYPQFKISIFSHNYLNLKRFSAIIQDPHLKFSVHVLIVEREGKVSQNLYSGPSFYFMKC